MVGGIGKLKMPQKLTAKSGVGIGGTDTTGKTFTYSDRKRAEHLLSEMSKMESIRVADDPLGVAATLVNKTRAKIKELYGKPLREGWAEYLRDQLDGRDMTISVPTNIRSFAVNVVQEIRIGRKTRFKDNVEEAPYRA